VELTKLLGAFEGHKYVNGVLDKIARHHALKVDQARRAAPAVDE
jgi:N utilization substance protein B